MLYLFISKEIRGQGWSVAFVILKQLQKAMDNTLVYNQVQIHEILLQSSVLFSVSHHLQPDINIDWIVPGPLGMTYGLPLPLLKPRLSPSAPVFVLKAFPCFSDGCKMQKEELGGFYLEWEEDPRLALD